MGDLKGHIIPGTFFILFGLWWLMNNVVRYLTCKRNGTKFVSSATYRLDCCGWRVGRLPVEGLVKVVLSVSGMLGELLSHLPVPPVDIVQHATMYFFFLVSGVVDIAMYYGTALPPATDYLSLATALTIEGLLFVSHVHDKTELDVHVHKLLVYVIFATVAVLGLEAKFRESITLSLTRAYLLMLQGTWFYAVGIILYGHGEGNTTWTSDIHDSVMMSTIYFSWHCAAIFILLALLMAVMHCFYRIKNGGNFLSSEQLLELRETSTRVDNSNGEYGILALEDSDDFESELVKQDERGEAEIFVRN